MGLYNTSERLSRPYGALGMLPGRYGLVDLVEHLKLVMSLLAF